MMTKLIGVLGALALASMGFVACTTSSDSGTGTTDGGSSDATSKTDSPSTTGDSGGGDSGSCKLPVSFGDKDCDTCVESNCCAKINACAAEKDCVDLDECIGACFESDAGSGDAGADAGGALVQCQNDCLDAHPTGKAKFLDSNECVQTNCEAQCK